MKKAFLLSWLISTLCLTGYAISRPSPISHIMTYPPVQTVKEFPDNIVDGIDDDAFIISINAKG